MKGQIDLGYEINKQRLFKIRLKKKNVVGDFYASFNKKAMFITKAHNEATGYSIRKNNWCSIMSDCPDVARPLKHKILTDFYNKIHKPMMLQKKRDIAVLCKNSEYKSLFNETNLSIRGYLVA